MDSDDEMSTTDSVSSESSEKGDFDLQNQGSILTRIVIADQETTKDQTVPETAQEGKDSGEANVETAETTSDNGEFDQGAIAAC